MQLINRKSMIWCLILVMPLVFAWACGGDDEADDDDDDDTYPGSGDDDIPGGYEDFIGALPDKETMTLTLPGDEKITPQALGELAEFYDDTVDMTRETNEYILWFLSIIDEIASYPPTTFDGTTAVWGPVDGTGLEAHDWKFTMVSTGGDSYTYHLDWRPKNSNDDEDFIVVWDGNIEESADTERRGIGTYDVDFDAAYALDPTVNLSGGIEVAYDTLTTGRSIQITYINLLDLEEDDAQPVNGTYDYLENADGSGEFLFDVWADVNFEEYHGAQYADVEHFWFNTRWQTDGPGRCDVAVTDGDLPAMNDDYPGVPEIVQVNFSECWDDGFLRVYYYDELLDEEGGAWPLNQEGVESSCVFDQQLPVVN
ncbi:MAG: hypothetical protein P9L99_17215 [Candidatus Lernaella stagnicola]|nr:hypothetical protein [Candidatus Lernaella stagnicola]